MNIDVVTIFPSMFESVFAHGIVRRAVQEGKLTIGCVDLRSFTTDAHRTVDDRPFGGGEGMVFKPEPLAAAIRQLKAGAPGAKVIYLSPQGTTLNPTAIRRLAGLEHLILLCGRYEGVDQRVIDVFVDEEISIGNYVLSGGEIPAMVLVDAVVRMIPGVVGHPDSTRNESFEGGLLDYPVYTRPADFEGNPVPEVLLSGDHRAIRRWRQEMALERTRRSHPELLDELEKLNSEVNTDEQG